MRYDDYQVNDFVTDESFRQWVISPDKHSNRFWKQWIGKHAEKQETIRQASLLVRATHLQGRIYREHDFHAVRIRIEASLFQEKGSKEAVHTRNLKGSQRKISDKDKGE